MCLEALIKEQNVVLASQPLAIQTEFWGKHELLCRVTRPFQWLGHTYQWACVGLGAAVQSGLQICTESCVPEKKRETSRVPERKAEQPQYHRKEKAHIGLMNLIKCYSKQHHHRSKLVELFYTNLHKGEQGPWGELPMVQMRLDSLKCPSIVELQVFIQNKDSPASSFLTLYRFDI